MKYLVVPRVSPNPYQLKEAHRGATRTHNKHELNNPLCKEDAPRYESQHKSQLKTGEQQYNNTNNALSTHKLYIVI